METLRPSVVRRSNPITLRACVLDTVLLRARRKCGADSATPIAAISHTHALMRDRTSIAGQDSMDVARHYVRFWRTVSGFDLAPENKGFCDRIDALQNSREPLAVFACAVSLAEPV
jgi:hypothetical protein